MLSAPITSLELQTQWRLPYKNDKTGLWEFFDGFSEWSWWIWDCLEFFPGVKTLKIVHTWHHGLDGLCRLKYCLDIEISGKVGSRSTDVIEPKKWKVVSYPANNGDDNITKLLLVGTKEREGREVQIECVGVSKEDLKQYGEQSYGWAVSQQGKSWL